MPRQPRLANISKPARFLLRTPQQSHRRDSSSHASRALGGNGVDRFYRRSLNGPLGLTVAPNGHILVVNGNDGFITEITPRGKQLAKVFLDNTGTPPRSGTLFGVTFDPQHGALFVDDGSNTLNSLN